MIFYRYRMYLLIELGIKRFQMININIGTVSVEKFAQEELGKGEFHHHELVHNLAQHST